MLDLSSRLSVFPSSLRVWVNTRVMPVELRGNEPHSVQQHLSATLYPCPSLRSWYLRSDGPYFFYFFRCDIVLNGDIFQVRKRKKRSSSVSRQCHSCYFGELVFGRLLSPWTGSGSDLHDWMVFLFRSFLFRKKMSTTLCTVLLLNPLAQDWVKLQRTPGEDGKGRVGLGRRHQRTVITLHWFLDWSRHDLSEKRNSDVPRLHLNLTPNQKTNGETFKGKRTSVQISKSESCLFWLGLCGIHPSFLHLHLFLPSSPSFSCPSPCRYGPSSEAPSSALHPSLSGAPSPWVSGKGGGPRYPPTPGRHRAARGWWGGSRVSPGKMAALASSLIRQRREVKDPQANRQIASKRKPCPKSNKSLCQKQILILISKVRLCGSRGRKLDKRPGEFQWAVSPFLPACCSSPPLLCSIFCLHWITGFWRLTCQTTD